MLFDQENNFYFFNNKINHQYMQNKYYKKQKIKKLKFWYLHLDLSTIILIYSIQSVISITIQIISFLLYAIYSKLS
ncbi:hypothetical protein pb186bvf_001245 [Paramecium bursaria]